MVRPVGNRNGTTQKQISVDCLHSDMQVIDGVVKGAYWDERAISKYRKQYKRKGEAGWPALPLVQWSKRDRCYLVNDGSHRIVAAQLEGAKSILCDVEQ